MFVRQSKYDEAAGAAMAWRSEFKRMQSEWNALVSRINDLGGEDFLQNAKIPSKQPEFTADDVQRLLMLCHPDKHDGKLMATEMTAKLLKLKETLK